MHGLLIVDGGVNLAAALAAYLGYQGFDAFPVHNEREAVDMLRAGAGPLPQAILVDIDGVSHNGALLLDALKASPGTANIPVIVVKDPGHDPSVDISSAKFVFEKPVSLEHLVRVLTRFCRRSA